MNASIRSIYVVVTFVVQLTYNPYLAPSVTSFLTMTTGSSFVLNATQIFLKTMVWILTNVGRTRKSEILVLVLVYFQTNFDQIICNEVILLD